MMLYFSALLAALAVGGPARPSPTLTTEFRLAPGESVTLEGTTLRLRFDRVVEDSRCPKDVTCVWAGDALVAVLVREGDSPERRYELHANDAAGGAVTHAGYRIRLVRLSPYPTSTTPIPARDYRAVLVVTRA